MNRSINAILAVLLIFILSSCAGMKNPDMASTAMNLESKKFDPAPGKSKIYIIRPSKFGGVGIYIFPIVNKMVTGALASGSYLMMEVLPGNYTISAAGNIENPGNVEIAAEAGEIYFVKMYPKVKIGVFVALSPGLFNKRIDKKEGQKLVLKSDLYKTMEYKPFPQNLVYSTENSKIYFIRPITFYGAASNHKFSPTVDNKVIGFLEKGSCLMTEISPGLHRISAVGKYEGDYILEMDALKDKNYYIKITPKMGMALPKIKLEMINEEEGSSMAGDCQTSEDADKL